MDAASAAPEYLWGTASGAEMVGYGENPRPDC